MSRSPASIIYDDNGNPIGVILNGSVYRLQTASSIQSADGTKNVTVQDDVDTPADKRLLVEADIKTGATINISASPVSTSQLVTGLLEDSGGSPDMIVNGSTTPVVFEILADPTDDIFLRELRFVMSADDFKMDGITFGKGGGNLPNGLLVESRLDSTDSTIENVQTNEDLLRFGTTAGINLFQVRASNTGTIVAAFGFAGSERLVAGSGDYLRVTIRDNLTTGTRGISYLTASIYGFKKV